ncbi:MAG: hypothetical protein KatS3mg053_3326 [Candidatus Roseilinea sp.]|nr:MAG: hypothetical protein KatS3mg053_3326 [Candidatus Roseilinea sp.]
MSNPREATSQANLACYSLPPTLFIIGVVAIIAIVFWLYRANKGDLQAPGKPLG